VSKPSRRISDPVATGLRQIGHIPTDDAEAALRFCQALARQVGDGSAEVIESQNGESDGCRSGVTTEGAASPELSVVIPIYNEEENLSELYSRLVRVLDDTRTDFEIVLVDDGSRDKSVQILEELEASDKRVSVIELARNFGHQVAITAGLDFARGRAIAVMDADLQDPPEVLPKFIAKWREGHDVVYAIREHRKEGWLKRTGYSAFYRLLRHVSNINIPLDAGDFCVMDRRVVDLLKRMPERNRFVRGIRSWVGLNQVGLPFERRARHAGTSKYTIGRLMLLALDGLISFSYVPLRIITALGLSVSFVSLFLAVFFFVKKLLYGLSPPGYASLIVSIFFLAGIQLVTLGVIGEYVGRIFEEAKRRPMYILRRAPRIR
jgi:glycosyltransferase involved in cell wall biosynthesis